jgi:hypothetical protein
MSSTDQPVPVSGEDQPDPRLRLLAERGPELCRRSPSELLAELDACDRAAGIRGVTGPFCECEHPKERHFFSPPHECGASFCQCNYYERSKDGA